MSCCTVIQFDHNEILRNTQHTRRVGGLVFRARGHVDSLSGRHRRARLLRRHGGARDELLARRRVHELANKDMFSEARTALGKDNVKNCKHCHVKALPKADDHEMNALGEYLLAQKAERGADTIDVNWLKDYTEMD